MGGAPLGKAPVSRPTVGSLRTADVQAACRTLAALREPQSRWVLAAPRSPTQGSGSATHLMEEPYIDAEGSDPTGILFVAMSSVVHRPISALGRRARSSAPA